MTRLIVIACLAICCSGHAQDDGMPFGQIGDADVDRLVQFAKKSGFDLKPEMERVYKKDEEALALFPLAQIFRWRKVGHIHEKPERETRTAIHLMLSHVSSNHPMKP